MCLLGKDRHMLNVLRAHRALHGVRRCSMRFCGWPTPRMLYDPVVCCRK